MSEEETRLRNLCSAFGLSTTVRESEAEVVKEYREYLANEVGWLRKQRDNLVALPSEDYSSDNKFVSSREARFRSIRDLEKQIGQVEGLYNRFFRGWEEALVRAYEWKEKQERRLA